MRTIAIFGGTFDPVHNGHIQTSINIQSNFNFDTYCFLPCKLPALKAPALASNEQRVNMLELAIKEYPAFSIDLREIDRESPSYMKETLENFRVENENASLTLIMGYDAFLSLPYWHEWQKIIKLANLLVINRNEFSQSPMPAPIKELVNRYQVMDKLSLLNSKAETIYFFNAGDYDISSTEIRSKLKHNKAPEDELPQNVYKYIKMWQLYQ